MSKKHSRSRVKKQRQDAAATELPVLFDNISAGHRHLIAGAFLILVSLAFFSSFHFQGKTVAPSDTIGWRASAQSITEYQDKTGDRALWATNMFSGMPAYMISYAPRSFQLDTIAKWLRHVIWPSSHFLFVLFGMYLLGFFVTRDWIASVLAAIGYGLTTYIPILILAGHNSKFIALCFAPWLVVAFLNVIRNPGLLSSLLFAAAAAINLRAGHVQITYFYVIGVFVLWLGAGINAYKTDSLPSFLRGTLFLLFGSAVAVLMVAQPYLANAEYKALSIRGASLDSGAASGLGWENAMAWSQGRAELLTLLIADSFGGGRLYWGPKSLTAGPHYVGGIIVVLALVAVVRRRDWLVLSIASACLVMIAFSLGENLAVVNRPAYNLLPLFSSFRAPETWLAAAAFFLALLAAFGLNEVFGAIRSKAKVDRTIWLPWFGVTALVMVLLIGKSTFFSFEKDGERSRFAAQVASRENVRADDPRVVQAVDKFVVQLQQDRMSALEKDAIRTLILLLLAGGLVYVAANNRRFATIAAVATVLLVLFDLFGVGRRYLSPDVMTDSSDLTEQIPRYDFDGFIVDEVNASGGPGHFRVLSLEGDPTTTARPSFYYESVGGYHGAKLRVYQEFLDNVLFAGGSVSPAGLSLLNVRYVVGRQSLPGFGEAYQSEQTGLKVFRNERDPGRAFFVSSVVGANPGRETWEAFSRPDFDLTKTAIVEPTVLSIITERIGVPDSSAAASVTLSEYGPRQITWDVETTVDRLLVVSEIYYPKGWHASIDGTASPIYMVDGLLRGVVVPDGSHELRMRFDPASDRIGGLVAASSTAMVYVGIALLLLVGYRRRSLTPKTEVPE